MACKPITPEQLAKSNSEHAHQVAVFCWAAMNFAAFPELKLLFAIPNGGERNKIVAANLKAEGVKDGVPDLFLPVARHGCNGLFIELKRPKSQGKQRGYQSPEQEVWEPLLREQGYGVAICLGWEAVRDCLIQYLTR